MGEEEVSNDAAEIIQVPMTDAKDGDVEVHTTFSSSISFSFTIHSQGNCSRQVYLPSDLTYITITIISKSQTCLAQPIGQRH